MAITLPSHRTTSKDCGWLVFRLYTFSFFLSFCRQEFVDLYIDYVLNKSVEKRFQAFSNGFLKVCGGKVLELFKPHELMAVVVGNENYDWHALESAAEYKNGYQSGDQTVITILFALIKYRKKFRYVDSLVLGGVSRVAASRKEEIPSVSYRNRSNTHSGNESNKGINGMVIHI